MRTLSATLTSAQKQCSGMPLVRIVLAKTGQTTRTYYGTDRILSGSHPETEDSQKATIVLDNSDNALTAIDFEGYTATLSYGYTAAGDEYSACAPLIVKSQEFSRQPGSMTCQLTAYGIPDQMKEDKASVIYTLTSSDTQTVKTLIDAIAGATLTCFNHCTTITVDYDVPWDDSLINSFCPKDYFVINVGNNRWDQIKELLGYTKDVMRVEADGHLHIFTPVVSGTTYKYEYTDVFSDTNHTFFNRVYRLRLVIPNRIVVSSHPDHEIIYTGEATDADSYALFPKSKFELLRLTSNAQAAAIAAAMIQIAQLQHERGSGVVPMNVGQEVYDYVRVTDSVENQSRTGNVGYLTRTFGPTKFQMSFGFGNILLGNLVGMGLTFIAGGGAGGITPGGGGGGGGGTQYESNAALWDAIQNLYANQAAMFQMIQDILDFLNREEWVFQKIRVLERCIIPVWE